MREIITREGQRSAHVPVWEWRAGMITVAAMRTPGHLSMALAVSSLALLASSAAAQPAEPGGAGAEDPPQDSAARWNTRSEPPRPAGLAGHVALSGSVAWVLPFGTISEGVSQHDRFGSGLGYQLDLGYGVGSSVVIGVWGQLLTLSDGSGCDDCAGIGFAGGPFVRYHLVQGLRFDPWFSFGIGYRSQSQDVNGVERSYGGLDWARVQFGGDWYALPQLGFGPFVELGAGNFFARPDDEQANGVSWRFMTGLRVAVDFPGHGR